MLNQSIVMGRLTADPVLRYTNTSKAVTSFSLAVERDFRAEDGEKTTDFLDCVAWGRTAEFICRYFRKGRAAVVNGSLQVRYWEDKEGIKRRSTEIIVHSIYFADSRMANQLDEPDEQTEVAPSYGELANTDVELPF